MMRRHPLFPKFPPAPTGGSAAPRNVPGNLAVFASPFLQAAIKPKSAAQTPGKVTFRNMA
jgi:hypothetical protein